MPSIKTIDIEKLIAWIAGFGDTSAELGHFASPEACADFTRQLTEYLRDDHDYESRIDPVTIRSNLIIAEELDGLLKLDAGKYEQQFHMAMIDYAKKAKANDESNELAIDILADFGISVATHAIEELDIMIECMKAYFALTIE